MERFKCAFRKVAITIMIGFSLTSLTSCARVMKDFSADFSYTDPQTRGGRWDVYTEGKLYENCKCKYWGAEGDENACFETEDGRMLFVNGTYSVVEAN